MRKQCLDMVHQLAKQDDRVVFIGSDVGPGTLDAMKTEFPDRFLMEGISEQHVVGMAAGVAMEGMIPYVNTIASFLTRRAFEQIAMDLCLHDLPVRLIGNGGGFVYAPLGPTHQAIEDISILRSLPNLAIVAPADAREMVHFMQASLDWPHPVYIRLGKGNEPDITHDQPFDMGKAVSYGDAQADIVLAVTGIALHAALEAEAILQDAGIALHIQHHACIKPFDATAMIAAAEKAKLVVTAEENMRAGGFGSLVLETLSDAQLLRPVMRLGIGDEFADHYGNQKQHLAREGLDGDSLARQITARFDGLKEAV